MTEQQDPDKGINGALARTLNAERVASRLSFADLSHRTGISDRQLKRLLSGMERTLSITVAEQIADALGLQLIEALTMAQARLDREQRDEPHAARGA